MPKPGVTKIEEVARALCKADGCDPDHEGEGIDEGRFLWRSYAPDARAAIAAMREPTPEMLAAPETHWGYSCHVCGGLKEGWYAFIDAALKE